MSLEAAVTLRAGSLDLRLDLDIGTDSVVAIVGPNGAGKTTLLRALCGLAPLRHGWVRLDGELLEDTASGLRLPPERRSVAVVFQELRLFPHMTALDNVAFGMRCRGATQAEAGDRALAVLEEMGMRGAAASRPAALSGGQAQRVALARALVTRPRLLLLDEPLASVDEVARVALRRLLRTRLAAAGGVRILVTHDPIEALALADTLVVVEGGRAVQQGPIGEVTARPRSPWVARMLGVNLMHGTAVPGSMLLDGGAVLAVASEVTGPALAVVHPRAVALHRRRPEGSPRNTWLGDAADLDGSGERIRVRVTGPVPVVAEVTPAAVAELRLAEGGPVWVSVKAAEVDVYPE